MRTNYAVNASVPDGEVRAREVTWRCVDQATADTSVAVRHCKPGASSGFSAGTSRLTARLLSHTSLLLLALEMAPHVSWQARVGRAGVIRRPERCGSSEGLIEISHFLGPRAVVVCVFRPEDHVAVVRARHVEHLLEQLQLTL